MSSDSERLFNAIAAGKRAEHELSSEEKEILENYNKTLDALREVNGIPKGTDHPDELEEEVFRMVPGSEQVLDKLGNMTDYFFDRAEETPRQ